MSNNNHNSSTSNSQNQSVDHQEVPKDYGPTIGRIIKIDLSSNGLLEVIAQKAAAC